MKYEVFTNTLKNIKKMSKTVFIAFLLLAGWSMNGQTLTNPGFENWTTSSGYAPDTVPTNWWPFYCNTVKQTTDAYQGAFATKIQGFFACGIAPGILVNGQAPLSYGNLMESGTPFNTKPATFSGYYKYNDQGTGDSAEVTVILKRYNATTQQRDTIAYSTKALPASSSYTMFTVNIIDLLPGVTPDSIVIMFNSSKYNSWNDSTWELPILYIDRINMPEAPNGIAEIGNPIFQSLVFPNPFSGSTTLRIDATNEQLESAQLVIVDMTGREVMRLENITDNVIIIEQGQLSIGNYIYHVYGKNQVLTKGKICIQ